jgi:anaerobic magnesium-protoporphyrin IX monomethyl ester cyclase
MKKRLLLILPPNVTVIPPFITAEQKHAPLLLGFPLGLGYIAAYLLQQGRYEVKILDANKDELSIPQILGVIKEFNPAYVGITIYTLNSKVAVQLAKEIKENFKDIIVIAGGPHVSDDYTNLLTRYPFFDFVVVGEGEITVSELLSVLDSGDMAKLAEVKGIAYSNTQGNVCFTGVRPLTHNIDTFPRPARELVDFNAYIRRDNLLPYAIEIIGSRGCSHRCVFCSFQKTWRARSSEDIVKEMKALIVRYPQTKSFLFFDDNLSVDKQRVIELCQLLIREGLNKYMWGCLCRTDQVDEEMIRWMKNAGCTKISFGVETADPKILKNLNKKISISQVKSVVEVVTKNGIDALAFFIIGNPGETRETLKLGSSCRCIQELHYPRCSRAQILLLTCMSRRWPNLARQSVLISRHLKIRD